MAELTREQLLMAIIAGRGPAYLRGINLSKLDLSNAGWLVEADLRGSNMSDVNLSGANLKGANLKGTNLRKSHCMKTNLEGADLRGANLNVINLQRANLRGANLQAASLIGANLAEADLSGADLTAAKLDGTNLDRANFEGANFGEEATRERILQNLTIDQAETEEMEELEIPVEDVEVIEEETEDSEGFHGKVNSIQLTDLIQMFCLSKSSFYIYVRSSGNEGRISVVSGQIAHAELKNVQGEQALFQILQWRTGNFETIPDRQIETATIKKPWEHLLIEGIRQRDQTKGDSERDSEEAAHGFTGTLKNIALTDLVQMVCLSRADLLLSLQSTDRHGTIYVCSGRLEHAQTGGNLLGEDALFEMLRWERGRFETIPYEGSGTVTINKPWEHLLIEGMRQRDEDGQRRSRRQGAQRK